MQMTGNQCLSSSFPLSLLSLSLSWQLYCILRSKPGVTHTYTEEQAHLYWWWPNLDLFIGLIYNSQTNLDIWTRVCVSACVWPVEPISNQISHVLFALLVDTSSRNILNTPILLLNETEPQHKTLGTPLRSRSSTTIPALRGGFCLIEINRTDEWAHTADLMVILWLSSRKEIRCSGKTSKN